MSETLLAYAEPRLQWRALSRYRPEAGLAFEKHAWMFPLRERAGTPGELLFERAGGVVVRDRRVCSGDGRDVPMAAIVDESSLPSLARVALSGRGLVELLGALLDGEDTVIHCPDFVARFGDQLAEPPQAPQPGLFRIPAEQARVSYETITAEPRAYLLASPLLPMPMRRLRSLLALSRGAMAGALPFAEFVELVANGRWLATSLGTMQLPMPGIALYGGADLIAAVERAAAACGAPLCWLDEPHAIDARFSLVDHIPLPSLASLPLDADDTLDASGYNLAELQPEGEATELVLDDTAVVDLGPLSSWKRLSGVSMRGLRPLSLAPITGVRRLRLGYIDQEHLRGLSGFHALEGLHLEGTPLEDLRPLSGCQELRSLVLRHAPWSTLRGIEALQAMERLSIHTASAPAELYRLAALPRLRELSIHVTHRFDLSQLPPLPLLERLEVCGLEDQGIELENTELLARYPSLQSLALRATNVATLEWLKYLTRLVKLDLEATDIQDLASLRNARQLRRLDLRLIPAADLSPLGELVALEVLDVSSVDAFEIGLLAQLSRLEELHLGSAEVRTPRDLPPLPRLRALDLAHTPLELLDGLDNLPALESLDLSGTQIDDVRLLRAQRALRRLLLIGCRISDIGPLASLTALEELALFATEVSDVTPLAHCAALRKLSLARLTIDDPSPLAALSRLHSLDLHGASLADPTSLGHLSSLRALDAAGASLPSIEPLKGLERLRELRAHHLAHAVDFSPILELPPLARLELSRTGLGTELEARLAARHHLVIVGE